LVRDMSAKHVRLSSNLNGVSRRMVWYANG
jgi:hypothetical protein